MYMYNKDTLLLNKSDKTSEFLLF